MSKANSSKENPIEPAYNKRWSELAKLRLQTTEKINEAVRSQSPKDALNSALFNAWIENIISRAYPEDENSTDAWNKISEMDCYYIPNMEDPIIQELLHNDEKIYEILYGLLCRPQFFWQSRKTWQRTLTKEWLDRLNYILNMAAKHTLRHIRESSLMHSEEPRNIKTPGFWDPSKEYKNDGIELTPWYNYFKDKLKNFTDSQRSDKDKKYKIYFKLKSKEQFCQLIRSLLVNYVPVVSGWSQIYPATYDNIKDSRYNNSQHRLKSTSTRIKDGLFLKNISCFADMERSDTYTWKRTHFPQTIREIIEPLLQTYKLQEANQEIWKKSKWQTWQTREKKELNNHEIEYSTNFNINHQRDKVWGKFILCTKSQDAMLDKTRRDVDYSTLRDLKDMIRWSFIMKDHHDVVFMLHYFIKYFIQNPEHNFDHSTSNNKYFDPQRGELRWLQLKDKWILNTEITQWIKNLDWLPKWKKPKAWTDPSKFTNEELDWAATNFILNSIEKASSKKSSNSTKYIDTKLIIPALMRPNPLPIEIKFLTKDNFENNEHGLAHHDIMRLKQNIQLRCRDEKFILADKIKREIELLLKRNPELKSQIESELIDKNRWKDNIDASEEIYKDITNGLVILKYWEWENWLEPTIFCDKEIWTRLKNESFTYSSWDINK